MKQAKVTVAFPGRPDEEAAVRQIAVGEVISGSLAEVALREGWAEAEATAPIMPDPPQTAAAAPAADVKPPRTPRSRRGR